jgi:hypothetical protein
MDVPFMDLMMDAIANPHLNDDLGAIVAFPDETFGLKDRRIFFGSEIGRPILRLVAENQEMGIQE